MTEEHKEGKLFNFMKRNAKRLIKAKFVLPKPICRFLFKERVFRQYAWTYIKSKLYYENIMRYRCKEIGENFLLFGEVPFMEGDGDIIIGNNVTMYGKVVMFTGGDIHKDSKIVIGDNTSIGFGVVFRTAREIIIGKNCMIGGGTRISDNDGHPIHAKRTEENTKVPLEDVKPVIIEDDVWIGEQSKILKGVTIGKGSIISTGSIVTKSIPPMKIAMGNPARAVMWVPGAEPEKEQN